MRAGTGLHSDPAPRSEAAVSALSQSCFIGLHPSNRVLIDAVDSPYAPAVPPATTARRLSAAIAETPRKGSNNA